MAKWPKRDAYSLNPEWDLSLGKAILDWLR